ncbi:hypothetical protein CD175_23055 [Pseudomonas laurylsulfatiphila]|uniref:Uncharacterized protein n=1 Tax=Pseudomonas laurylsulfatiphila TaxID=2011015 RepID=A0A2S6FGG3_9PSED|nr:hypothetical protein [Pseudomonas laurylsulfatiphila]PPK36495.1 hypothetical protein CD175_23055 [Pseudomonas laurylsulfatiphila]
MYLLKKSFRNNDLSLCIKPFGATHAPGSDYALSQAEAFTTDVAPSPRPVIGVNICDYFFLQGLVTWLDTPILSRTIQEVIDARQLV